MTEKKEASTEKLEGGMYRMFKTDESLEKNGILIDYTYFRVTIARAGGGNKKFTRVMEAKAKPNKRAIQTETIEPEKILELLREAYAESIILNWEVKVGEDEDKNPIYKQGIEGPDGKLMPFTKENVLKTLRVLPDLFTDLQEQATKSALFREEIREADAKN